MRKFILDCDPGIDDLVAMAYLLKNTDNVLGITTVAGNTDCEYTTLNTLKLLSLINSDVKVYKGALKPLMRDSVKAIDIHGIDGSHGILNEIKVTGKIEDIKASEFIVNSVLENKNEVEIIAIGPLTNIACALMNNPECKNYLKHIYIMGGSYGFGNITPSAEFNFYADPDAAKYVFESGIPITMVGLDATMFDGLTKDELADIEKSSNNSQFSIIINKLLKKSLEVSYKFKLEKAYLHDLITVIAALHDNFIETKKYFVSVETKGKFTIGKSIVDITGVLKREANAEVAFSFDKNMLIELIKNILN